MCTCHWISTARNMVKQQMWPQNSRDFSLFRNCNKSTAKCDNELACSGRELIEWFSCGTKNGMTHPARRGGSRKTAWRRRLLVCWVWQSTSYLAGLGFRATENSSDSRNACGMCGKEWSVPPIFFSRRCGPKCLPWPHWVGELHQGHGTASKLVSQSRPLLLAPV